MFEVSVVQDFSAAHKLNNYSGKCSNIHGHTWKVEVIIQGETLDDIGMLVDFHLIKKELTTILDKFDHGYLNEQSPFNQINPTAENIAREVYQDMKKLNINGKIARVKVWESPTSCASYWEVK